MRWVRVNDEPLPVVLPITAGSSGSTVNESRRSSRNRTAIFLGVGALCAAGLILGVMAPGPPTSTVAPSLVPQGGDPTDDVDRYAFDDATVGSTSTPSTPFAHVERNPDPRAFVINELLSGTTGSPLESWSEVSTAVTSRSGDVVLVTVSGIDATGKPNELSVLVVYEAGTWQLREVYSSETVL